MNRGNTAEKMIRYLLVAIWALSSWVLISLVVGFLLHAGFSEAKEPMRVQLFSFQAWDLPGTDPGPIAFTQDLSVRDALFKAGYRGRKLDRIAIVRNGQRIRLPVAEVWSGKVKGPKLQAGDEIQVPELGLDPAAITIIRAGKRIQVTRRALRSGKAPKLLPDDLIFIP